MARWRSRRDNCSFARREGDELKDVLPAPSRKRFTAAFLNGFACEFREAFDGKLLEHMEVWLRRHDPRLSRDQRCLQSPIGENLLFAVHESVVGTHAEN
jgi:hypothetical protein